jgi:putative endonuclease
MNQQELGIYGENLACRHLIKKGYMILNRNYHYRKNEVDIIATFENQLIIVEVKTRQTAEIGEPWKSVTRSKQKSIIQVANDYIIKENIHIETRFDIISIIHNGFRTELEHIEDAFSC